MKSFFVVQLVLAVSAGCGCYSSSSPRTPPTSPTTKTDSPRPRTQRTPKTESWPPSDDWIHADLPKKKPIPPELLDRVHGAYVKGRVLEWVQEEDGKPDSTHRWEITDADKWNGVTIWLTTRDKAGTVIYDYTDHRDWETMVEDSLLPAGYTLEDNVTIKVPAGTYATRLYTTSSAGHVRRYWYTKDEHGILVQASDEVDGKQLSRMRATRIR